MRIWKRVFAVVLCVALLLSIVGSKSIAKAKEDERSASLAYS